jgi:hypothetical protein
MIVSRARRFNAISRLLNDLEPGEFVRRKALRGVGLVESVGQGFAWVAWKDGRKDYLPIVMLRRVRATGHDLDARKQ